MVRLLGFPTGVGVLVALAGIAVTNLRAQDAAPGAQRFRAGIDVVSIDVSVLDRARRPVRGLSAKDFVSTDDGAPRRIVAVSEVSVPALPDSGAAWLRHARTDVATNDLAARRLTVIVIDDATGRNEPVIVDSTRRIVHRVVDGLGPADVAAVVFTNASDAQNFTDDRDRLRRAIDRFTVPLVPTSLREFRGSDRAHVLARVHQGGAPIPVAVRLTGRVIDERGLSPFEQRTQLDAGMFASGRTAEGVFELPLQTLAPGQYLLHVEAASAAATVSRELRFRVTGN